MQSLNFTFLNREQRRIKPNKAENKTLGRSRSQFVPKNSFFSWLNKLNRSEPLFQERRGPPRPCDMPTEANGDVGVPEWRASARSPGARSPRVRSGAPRARHGEVRGRLSIRENSFFSWLKKAPRSEPLFQERRGPPRPCDMPTEANGDVGAPEWCGSARSPGPCYALSANFPSGG